MTSQGWVEMPAPVARAGLMGVKHHFDVVLMRVKGGGVDGVEVDTVYLPTKPHP